MKSSAATLGALRGWRLAMATALLCCLPGSKVEAQPVRWEIAQGGNGHYYELVEQDLSWPLARVAAAQRTPPGGYGPGHLASFSSAAEEAFLDSTFGNVSGWIGFTDELVEGEWRWIDATPGIWQDPSDFASPIQTAYVDWAPGEPNGAQHENYAIFAWSGIQWNDGSGDPAVVFSYYVEYEPASTVVCSNNIDDDGDGLVDYPNDPGCSSATDDSERDPSIACDDGADNDGDGAIDFLADPGCTAPADLSEVADCNDTFDNDGDGFFDFPDDPDCGSPSDANESPGAQCSDGLDNDGDGFIDSPEDPECASPVDASESNLVLWDAATGGNSHYYEIVKTPLSWPAASLAAEQRTPPAGYGPGHLASISSAAEDGFLWQTFRLDGPVFGGWMGFTDEVVEGEWRWIDGTPGIWQDPDAFPTPIQTVPYVNWAGGEPNNAGNADYATFGFVSDQWNDDGAAGAYYVEYEPIPGPACDNANDDDGDGATDFPADPGCSDAADESEHDPALACDDGLDNDGDGEADYPRDPDCESPTDPEEALVVACNDGVDNDGDGAVDFPADAGCLAPQGRSEVRGDLDFDGVLTESDRAAFAAAFGLREGDAGYLPEADFDGDGQITIVDYQSWLAAYEADVSGQAPVGCGLLGIEPLALLLGLRAIRRRRSR